MMERPCFNIQHYKLAMSRRWSKLILFCCDLVAAWVIGWITCYFLPNLPAGNHILSIWLFALAIVWIISYDTEINIRLDAFLTYARAAKIACWSGLGYLLFFVVTRQYYSLKFIVIVTISWMLAAMFMRRLLRQHAPIPRGLALTHLPATVTQDKRVAWTIAEDTKLINLAEFDFVAVDFNHQYPKEYQELLTHAHVAHVPILSMPQVVEHLTGKIAIEHLNDFWVENTFYVNPLYLRCKRVVDIVVSLLLAPLWVPLTLIVAVLIRCNMGRPVLFRQQRIGVDNKPFTIVKFRTMTVDAEREGAAFAKLGDLRITRLGKWLRKLRLDELPQFYNVLKGDMSLIGPRPEQKPMVEKFAQSIPMYQIRHWLRPGITGWAQVMHGYAASEDETSEKLRYDMFYLKNLSLWLDIVILLRTFYIVITGFGSR